MFFTMISGDENIYIYIKRETATTRQKKKERKRGKERLYVIIRKKKEQAKQFMSDMGG